MKYVIIFSAFIGFLTTIYAIKWFIRYAWRIGLVVKDQNKIDKPLIPISGGVAVMAGFFIGILSFIFLRTFFYNSNGGVTLDTEALMLLFTSITSILMITFVGFVDDLLIRKDKESSIGLKRWQKPLLTLVAAIPLMAIKAGTTTMQFPFIGRIDIGIIYPLILVPLLIVFAANVINMLAGFNGLEAGMGIVYTGMLGLYSLYQGKLTNDNDKYIAALIALMVFSALIAFYLFNMVPAKIFPGDSLTYLLGSVLAVIAIVGNLEKAVIIALIPFGIEFILKARGKFKKQSYGYYKEGKVQSLYKEIYSIPHLFTRTGKFTERQIVYFLILIEFGFCSLIWVI